MSERKKKTGDVAQWCVLDRTGSIVFHDLYTRQDARGEKDWQERTYPHKSPCRIAKVVLAK